MFVILGHYTKKRDTEHTVDKREIGTIIVAVAGAIGSIAKLIDRGLEIHQNSKTAMDAYWNGSAGRKNFENQATFISSEYFLLASILCENDKKKSKRRAEQYINDQIR